MLRVLAPLLAALLVVCPAPGQEWQEPIHELDQLLSSELFFGWSAALSGDVCVIGARFGGVCSSGSAVVFRRDAGANTWSEEQSLTPDDLDCLDELGRDAAIEGDTILVASRFHDDRTGAVYVFEYDADDESWSEEQTLSASDAADDDEFGSSVAIHDGRCVVGARGESSDEGAAYVFNRSSIWLQRQKLTASDGVAGDKFGETTAIHEEVLLVGAPLRDERTGAVYVFRYDDTENEWLEETILTASDGEVDDTFGATIAVSEDVIAIGAPIHGGATEGAVYIYTYDSILEEWGDEFQLQSSDIDDLHRFGSSVSLLQNKLAIGAIGADAAYLFRFDEGSEAWIEEKKLIPDGEESEREESIGFQVSLSADLILVSALDSSDDEGRGYVFYSDCPFADANCDGEVDDLDLCTFLECQDSAAAACLRTFDSDGNEEIDVDDLDSVLADYSGDLVDCDGNEVHDIEDIAIGDALDCDGNCVPDSCDPDEDSDGVIDACEPTEEDILEFLACYQDPDPTCIARHDQNGDGELDLDDVDLLLDIYDLPADCNDNDIPDIRDILVGTEEDCNCDWIPDSCQPDEDDDGIADVCEAPRFKRGDVDSSGRVECLVDVLSLLAWGFGDGSAPPCRDAADVNDDNIVVPLTDAVFLLDYCFADGIEPPDPGPHECCPDPTDDNVGCVDPADECD